MRLPGRSGVLSQLNFERLFIIIFIIAIILRFIFLDLKLFHHDEAIHSWFSYRLLTQGEYQYDPVFHGPFLYYATAGIFWIFGDSDLIARIIPVVLGTLIIPLIFCIYRLGYLDKKQTLVASLFVAISPSLVYFSRFLRNDIFILFFTILLLVALLYYFEYGKGRYAILAAVAIGLGMSTKENMPFVILIFGSYILYLIYTKKLSLPVKWIRDLLMGSVIVALIIVLFYSSFGMHPDIALDWWMRAIEHWLSIHGNPRLDGPPYYYVIMLLLYELPILILGIVGMWQFFIQEKAEEVLTGSRKVKSSENISFNQLVETAKDQLFSKGRYPEKIKTSFERKREFTRFCIYWFLLSMIIYGYVGEKVPWLLIHSLLPLIFISVYLLGRKKLVFVALSVIFLFGMTVHISFVPQDISEPIIQVQNSEDLRQLLDIIPQIDRVNIASETYWPLPWYCRKGEMQKLWYINKEQYNDSVVVSEDADIIIMHDQASLGHIEGYEKRTIKLNYWFDYYNNQDRLLEYYFTRSGQTGSTNINLFIKEEII